MEHPTDGAGHEVPESDVGGQTRQPIAPVTAPTGLDYTLAGPPPPAPTPPAPTPPAPTPPAEPVVWKRQSSFPVAIVAFLAAMVGSLATVGLLTLAGYFNTGDTETAPPPTTTVTTTSVATATTVPEAEAVRISEAVWQKVNPSIVTVEVGPAPSGNEAFIPDASGSGVAIGNGHIVTNHHVIEGSDKVQIVLQNGRIYDADVVGSDPLTDLAVLSSDAADLVAIDLGSTDELVIGEPTIAIGNPLGQSGGASLTVGVLSALDRRVDFDDGSSLYGMLQTDAPIINGSSGGALVDEHGALIGITSAIGVSESGAEGIGYAIPVDLVRRITDEIIEVGEVHHAFLGISGFDHIAESEDGARVPGGAEIEEIETGYSAERAGLEAGDVIVSMDGAPVDTMSTLVVQLRLYHVGDVIDVRYLRDGVERQTSITLDERPEGV